MGNGEKPTFQSVLLAIERGEIARLKAIVESYDNLATVRTDDPRHHYVRLYFGGDSAAEVDALIDALGAVMSVRRI